MYVQAQEFSFNVYFEDAVGNKDSITLGYDENATDSLDSAFGEENLVGMSFKLLDVLISSLWFDQINDNCDISSTNDLVYLTKKNILAGKDCERQKWDKILLIHCKNYPLKITWDSTLFIVDDSCAAYSFIGSWHPKNQPDWKVECDLHYPIDFARLMYHSSVTQHEHSRQFLHNTGDTLNILFFDVYGPNVISPISQINERIIVDIYPNPVQEILYIYVDMPLSSVPIEFRLYRSDGLLAKQQMLDLGATVQVAVENLLSGLYFYTLQTSNQVLLSGKLLKAK